MHRILVADPVNAIGLDMLRQSGAEVHQLTEQERPRLTELIADFDALVVRSATTVTADLLAAGKRLKVVGRAGIGVDNVDVAAATERGILVVNAPTANVLSATEHTFALLFALARRVSEADTSLKDGAWDRKKFVGVELYGKTLGIIGFGRIGQRVAARARGFEMKVLAYDPFLDETVARRQEVEPLDLDTLLERSDVITLHTPLTEQTRGLIDAERLGRLKPGALVINCGRGGVLDEKALLAALESGHVAGAGLDVYEKEPLEDFALVRHPRVVATPHLGASTREAQERIATETARMLLKALEGSLAITAVNLPFRTSGPQAEPYLLLGEKLGRLGSELLDGKVQRVEVLYWEVPGELHHPVGVAVLKGALGRSLGDGVNYVNAERLARDRRVDLVTDVLPKAAEYPQLISVRLEGPAKEGGLGAVELAGTVFGHGDARVVGYRGFRLEFKPDDQLLLLRNRDVPGVVGQLGTLLGQEKINIAGIHLAREAGKEDAVAVLRLDQQPSAASLKRLRDIPEVLEVHTVDLR